MAQSWQIDYTGERPERVILVGVRRSTYGGGDADESISELSLLTVSANGEVVDAIVQERKHIDPATYIGKGKAGEVAALVKEKNADTVIFDEDLSPGQSRNLENIIKCKIIDRTGLILDIFAQHARTREAKTQVELAQLQYILPRLAGHWSHFSRQRGGIGLRGPGETQLEVDRRLIRRRIAKLKEELEKIELQRSTRRSARRDVFKAALIGYTNAGKSTLMNALTSADVLVEDKLFATLDSTVRKMMLPSKRSVLLSDTVGFIKKLPHHLVASFHSTLGEVRDADLLVHVIDLSHPNFRDQMESVNDVLRSMQIKGKPVLMVFNKIDRPSSHEAIPRVREEFPRSLLVSARKGLGLAEMGAAIDAFVAEEYREFHAAIPAEEREERFAEIKKYFEILETTYDDGTMHVKFRGSPRHIGRIKEGIAAPERE